MTVLIVIASWISLQNYGSTEAPETFSLGKKLFAQCDQWHQCVWGQRRNLRLGLTWQSVHERNYYVHDFLRLSGFNEALQKAIIGVLKQHENLQAFFDNHWLHIFPLEENGQMACFYEGLLKSSAISSVAERYSVIMVTD